MDEEVTIWAAGLLFDLDCTLIDSVEASGRHWAAFAERHGLDPVEVQASTHGRRAKDIIDEWVPGEHVTQENAWFTELEVSDVEGVHAMAGAAELLESLDGVGWGIVTSSAQATVVARLGAAGLSVPALIIGADDVTEGKPDPEGYLVGLVALGVSAKDAVVFEDAPAGVSAGLAAGIDVVGLTTTYLEGMGATYTVRDLNDVRVIERVHGGVKLGLRVRDSGAETR